MEQEQDQQVAGNHVGAGPQGQKIHRFFATLVCAGLISAGFAPAGPFAPSSAPQTTVSASQSTDKPGEFSATNAWKHLIAQCDLGPRPPGTEAHIKCRDLILVHVKKYCDEPRLQPFRHFWSRDGKPYQMWNVVGEQNWKNAKVRVVLLAHWDTRPTADQEEEPLDRLKPIIGANDGASGVAVLLELMRVMKGRNPDLGIQYVFVDGEDLGPDLDEMFLGARHYVKNLPSPRPQYGILLDMIGDKDLTVPIEYNSYVAARSVINALYRHAATVDLKATFPNVVGQAIEDDHLSLIAAGIPTVDLIDFTYPAWHTLQDTPDKCSPESLGKVGKLLETFLTKSPPFNPAEK